MINHKFLKFLVFSLVIMPVSKGYSAENGHNIKKTTYYPYVERFEAVLSMISKQNNEPSIGNIYIGNMYSIDYSTSLGKGKVKSWNDFIVFNKNFLDECSKDKECKTDYEKTLASVNELIEKVTRISNTPINVDSPLKGVGFGMGLEAEYSQIPISVKAIYGITGPKMHSIGIDYLINRSWRVGVSVLYASGSSEINRSEINNEIYRLKESGSFVDQNKRVLKEKMPVYMANIQYNLVKEQVSPYFRASLGLAQHKLSISGKDMVQQSIKSQYNSFAYGIGAGLYIKMSQNISVDCNYTLNNFGFKDKTMVTDHDTIFKIFGVQDKIKVKKVDFNHNFSVNFKIQF